MQSKLIIYTILGLIVGTVPAAGLSYLQIGNAQANLDTAKSALEKMVQDNSNLKNQLDTANTKISNLQGDLASRNAELVSKNQSITVLNNSNLLLQNDRTDLQSQLTKAASDSQKLQADKTELQRQADTLSSQVKSLSDQIAPLQQSVSALQTDKASLQQQVSSLTTERANLQSQVNQLAGQVSSLGTERNNLQAQVGSLQGQVSNLNSAFNALKRDYDSLKVKWDLWKMHSDLAPQSRSSFKFMGEYVPRAGTYNIDKAALFFSFPDPENCLLWGGAIGTGSMRPAFYSGHINIFTKCFTEDDFRPGDIIVYSTATGNIHHQIIQILPDGVITKGIHNEVADPTLVKWEQIIGLQVAVIYGN